MMPCLKKFNAFQNAIKLSRKQNNTSIHSFWLQVQDGKLITHPSLLPPKIPLKLLKTDGRKK